MNDAWCMMTRFTTPSVQGAERQVMERVERIVSAYVQGERLERLKTAVAEGALNAIEHGNQYRPELAVTVEVRITRAAIEIRITDQGKGQIIPQITNPDIEAKLAGLDQARGWGLFLIRNMSDEMRIESGEDYHTLELRFNLERSKDEQPSS